MTVLNPPPALADTVRAGNRPTLALADVFDRDLATANTVTATPSGTLRFVPIYLTSGLTVSSITFFTGNGGPGTPTNQWFALYTTALARLGTTTDDTTTFWAANTGKTLSLSAPVTVTTPGYYLLGLLVVATTVPTLQGALSFVAEQALAPVLNGTSTAGLTNPASAPNPAAAITPAAGVPYAYVS